MILQFKTGSIKWHSLKEKLFLITGNNAANTLKGTEPDSSDSSDEESKDPFKLKNEMAAVGKFGNLYIFTSKRVL